MFQPLYQLHMSNTNNKKLRPIPIITEINIFIINVAFATLHIILKPTGLEQIVSALAFGNLFGLLLPYFGVIAVFAHVIIRPILDYIIYNGAYQEIILDNRYTWIGGLLFLNVIVGLTDKSHLNVEGADQRGGHNRGIISRLAWEFWFASFDYLQMTVVPWDDNATLSSSDRQYIFAVHPHGIHCSPLGLFHCKETPFDKRFPGICDNKLSGLAATIVFKIPGAREFFLSLPYIDASRGIAEAALNANRSLFICTGSGEESLLTKRGEDVLILSRRKGFIRLALAYGCDIVPIFGIGNSDLFATYSIGMGIRMWLQKRLHISIPIFHGRFLTPCPYKVPVRVLVGEPLRVPKPKVRGEKPNDALVQEYLTKYIERVKDLHKKNTTGRKLTVL